MEQPEGLRRRCQCCENMSLIMGAVWLIVATSTVLMFTLFIILMLRIMKHQ
jgi:hypothetical protein